MGELRQERFALRTAARLTCAALLFVSFFGGCSDPEPPSPAPPPAADPEAPAAEPEAPVEATGSIPSDSARDTAVEQYRALVRAYNRRDADAYFASFEDTLRCFYGRSDVPLSEVREQRWGEGARGLLAAVQLTVLRASEDEVVLLDRGFFSEDPASRRQVLHEKVVVLHRVEGAWRIVAETNRAGALCLGAERIFDEVPAEAFGACRSAQRSCMHGCSCDAENDACHTCRATCHDESLACLGLRPRAASAASAEGHIEGPDDVRRFVRIALAMQSNEEGAMAAEEGIAPADMRWYEGVSTTLGRPRWRITGNQGACSAYLFPRLELQAYDPLPQIEEVRCTPERDRCVVWLRGAPDDDDEVTLEMHLLFEGERLRVAHIEEPRPHAAPDESALARYAETHPAEWDGPCQATLVALVEDRVGEDFWELGGFELDADENGNEIEGHPMTRICGEAARRAVQELGDLWDCNDTDCGPISMCGNYCEGVGFDESGDVLWVGRGIDIRSLRPEEMSSLRARVPCGQTRMIPSTE